jgi:GT2 family glycosyltransferase
MKQPSVAIILLNWNGYRETIPCIEMLQTIDYKNYQIVLIDNGSRDDSVKILKARFPQITLIEIKHNKGFSGGANVGINYAIKDKFDYVLLLNNDVIVKKDFLTELVNAAESNSKIGVVSSMIYYLNNKKLIQSAGGYKNFKGLYPFKDPNQRTYDEGQFTKNFFVDTLIGCSMLIKRELVEKIGVLDENHFIYAEDVDFSTRAKKAGYLLCTAVKSKVWHHVSASSGGREKNLTFLYYNTRNLIYFSKKHLVLSERIDFNLHFIFGRILETGKLFLQREYKSCKAILFGIFHGYSGKMGRYQLK